MSSQGFTTFLDRYHFLIYSKLCKILSVKQSFYQCSFFMVNFCKLIKWCKNCINKSLRFTSLMQDFWRVGLLFFVVPFRLQNTIGVGYEEENDEDRIWNHILNFSFHVGNLCHQLYNFHLPLHWHAFSNGCNQLIIFPEFPGSHLLST